MSEPTLEEVVARCIADQVAGLVERINTRIDAAVDKAVAAKPLPPFVPPGPWMPNVRHGASMCVRHRNGIFMAMRDTDSEPGVAADGSWMPLLVGVADIAADFTGRTLSLAITASDGRPCALERALPIPVYRGLWQQDDAYAANDLVTQRGAIWAAQVDNKGQKPGTDETGTVWKLAIKSGERAARPQLALDDNGLFTLKTGVGEEVIQVGSIRALLTDVLRELIPERL